ncbi:MAG: adenylate/guanylate cyclase domain-containing protein [Spirochaetaceae bacterium]|nr:adenylate/guanylate cyclase domain-containing protein [Spirochaetaceae bacterium]
MKLPDGKTLRAHAPEFVFSLILIVWYIATAVSRAPGRLSPLFLPIDLAARTGSFSFLAALVAWSAALLAIWKLAAPFLRDKLGFAKAESTAGLAIAAVESALVVAAVALHAVAFAARSSYFSGSSPFGWMVGLVAVGFNASCLVLLIRSVSRKNAAYDEYFEFRRAIEKEKGGLSGFVRRRGIQRRITVLFTAFIFAVIAILAVILLRDFSNTILGAVIDKGEGLADRAASVVKSSVGDRIAVEDFFSIEAKKNEGATFPFEHLSYFRRDPKTGVLAVLESTEAAEVGKAYKGEPFKLEETDYLVDRAGGTIEFRAPVTLSSVYLGYVSVVYESEVIFEPYFRTQVKVWIIAAFFVYASIFLTYLIGRTIVFPILFLRMSVNSISSRLSGMIKGESRVSADYLRYEDRVTTKDEIKKLSLEIGNMATVIRGVIPYISASTLMASERSTPTTESRDLAFLFTDIRGFTTLCEGRSPEEVVTLLNHYLEIQSDAIIANGGDVDKFVGDEIMAMFDGPDKELKACRAGLSIRHAMAEEREKARASASTEISIGIGINSGPVVFGSVGAKDRMDFTSIGDTVNLAARLEGANKTYGTKSLVTEAVADKVGGEILLREIDLLTVKGKTKPVRIFEVLQERSHANPKLERLKAVFEIGLAAYRAKSWAKAEKAFGALVKEFNDETSAIFLRRVELFKASPPPADWDGVFAMKVK